MPVKKMYYGYWDPTWINENGKAAAVKASSFSEARESLSNLGYGNPSKIVAE